MADTQVKRLIAVAAALLCIGCAEDGIDGPDGGDTTPPEVLSTSPAEGEQWPADAPLSVVFNEDVTPDSVQDGIAVIGIDVDVNYDAASQTAAIHPHNPLPTAAALTLSVRRIEDLAGNVMPGILTINFYVE